MNKNELSPNHHLVVPNHYINLNSGKRRNCFLTIQNNVANNFNGGANDSNNVK